MNVMNKYNSLKKKIEGVIEEGDKLSKYLSDISDVEDEVYFLAKELRENEDLLASEGGVEDLCEELYELYYESRSWLPSSMRC